MITKIICCLVAVCTAACTLSHPDTGAARAPGYFLEAVKNVAKHDDLTDYNYIANELRLKIQPEPSKKIFDAVSGDPLGVGHDFVIKGQSSEVASSSIRTTLYYGYSQPLGRNFERVIFSEVVDEAILCVTAPQIFKLFGDSRPIRDLHAPSVNYKYSFKGVNEIDLIFSFDSSSSRCVNSISFYQNNLR